MQTIKLFHNTDPTVYITVGYTTDTNGNVTTVTRLQGGSGNSDKRNEIIWQHIENSAKQSKGLGSLKIAIQQRLYYLKEFEDTCDKATVKGFAESKADFEAFEAVSLRDWCNF